MGVILNVYILISTVAFIVTAYRLHASYDNYFALALAYWSEPMTNLALYNFCLAIIMLLQKLTVSGVFGEMKENEKIRIIDKLKMKGFEILFVVVLYHDEFTFTFFLAILLLVLTFVMHHLMVLRSEYLITMHNLGMREHYRILAFFLCMLFIDYEIVKYSYKWILSHGGLPVIFLFYIFKLLLMSLQPFIKLSVHIYERFTLYEFKNLDYRLSIVCFVINLPRLIILIVFVLWIMLIFRFSIFFLFMLIELVVELIQLIKGFRKMKELTHTMENLPKVTPEEMKKQRDATCTVCLRDMEEGRKLPCNHIFHQECLKQWIQKNTNHFCPKCKRPFDFDRMNEKKEPEVAGRQAPNPEFMIKKHLLIDNPFLPQHHFQKTDLTELQKTQLKQQQTPSQSATQPVPSHQPRIQTPPTVVNPQFQSPILALGSLPYCMPTQAVYERRREHFAERDKLRQFNAYLTSTLAYSHRLQMLIIPE